MMLSASVRIIRSGAGIFLKVNWIYSILYLIAVTYLLGAGSAIAIGLGSIGILTGLFASALKDNFNIADIYTTQGIIAAIELSPLPKGIREIVSAIAQIVTAFDPNDIIGISGYGDEKHLKPDQFLSYTIHFENQASATAPAVLVAITNQLDSDLDLNTFELDDFGFGNIYVDVPAGLKAYSTRLDLRDKIGSFVDFNASLDTATRTVTWKITTIDPITGQSAQGATDGFLPPNNTSHDGEGFINYHIKAKGDVVNGTSIDAKANIIFDTNAPIETPVWTNKIDTAAPTSTITALPATTNTTDFTVTWTGSDSGVASYDIYVSDNSGAFQPTFSRLDPK